MISFVLLRLMFINQHLIDGMNSRRKRRE